MRRRYSRLRQARLDAAKAAGGGSVGLGVRPAGGTIYMARYLRAIEDGLTARENGPVRSLADMTPEEIAALEKQYGAKIKR